MRVAPAATRAIEKLPAEVQRDVADKLAELGVDPRPRDARKLHGRGQVYRVPVARSFRVIYQIRDAALVVLVVKVADRKDVYKRLGDVERILKQNP